MSEPLDVVNVRLLLNDGDNQSMQRVLDATDAVLADGSFAEGVRLDWGGETYLNLVWQNEMVDGMLTAFLSTLGVVLLLLVLLFRSIRWALLAMLPVAWTKGTDFKRAPRYPSREITYVDGFARTWERGPSDPPSIADGPGAVVEVDIKAPPRAVWPTRAELEISSPR